MTKKIVICADFLMTREVTQNYHLRWFATFVKRAILNFIPPHNITTFVSDEEGFFLRKDFFSLSDINFDEFENATHFYFNSYEVSQESLNLLKSKLLNSLVIGYELSEETRHILTNAKIKYIDVWLHPIRFMDDNFFAFRSNSASINEQLLKYHISTDVYYLYADKLKVQSYMGWNKYEARNKNTLIPDSALFVGQTLTDKAICREGKMLNILDFKDELRELAEQYNHVYFSRHPMLRGDDSDQLEFISSFDNVTITNLKGYELLTSTEISHVCAVSSSLVYESLFFDKSISYFYRPIITIASDTENGYYSCYDKLHSPKFWLDILNPVLCIPTKDIRDITFFKKNNTYRDMLSLFYNNDIFEKEHATFIRSPSSTTTKGSNTKKNANQAGYLAINQISVDKLKNDIDKYDVISFDIFDTLLERTCFNPGDVVPLACKKIHEKLNIPLERLIELRKIAKKHSTKTEVTLLERYEICTTFLNLPKDIAQFMVDCELETERSLLKKKEIGEILFNYAKEVGKRVIVTSDTYFDHDFIVEVLTNNGFFTDEYYLSSSYDATKEKGQLFEVLKEKETGKLLHIGDNKKADYDNAIKKEVDSRWLLSSHDHLKIHFPNFVQIDGTYAQIKNGLIKSNLAKYPTITNNLGYSNGNIYYIGYNLVGDIMFAFAAWIIEQAQKNNIRKLYFFARDGDIVKKVVDTIISQLSIKNIHTEYLYASRRCLRVISLISEEDYKHELFLAIEDIKSSKNSVSLREFLSLRFGITQNILSASVIDDLQNIYNKGMNENFIISLQKILLSENIKKAILENAYSERKNYLKYLQDKGLCEEQEKPIAFIDIGHHGTLQASLSRILHLKNTYGFYFASYKKIDSVLSSVEGNHYSKGFYRDRFDSKNIHDFYTKYALLIENFFLNENGTFLHFHDDNGLLVPIFFNEANPKRIQFSNLIHKGTVEYAQDVLSIVKSCSSSIDMKSLYFSEDICKRLASFFSQPTYRDASMLSGVSFENYFSARPPRYIIPPLIGNELNKKKIYLWKEGARALELHLSNRDNKQQLESKKREDIITNKLSFYLKIEKTIIEKVLLRDKKNLRKLYKYRESPYLFFNDSKNFFLRAYGKIRNK